MLFKVTKVAILFCLQYASSEISWEDYIVCFLLSCMIFLYLFKSLSWLFDLLPWTASEILATVLQNVYV